MLPRLLLLFTAFLAPLFGQDEHRQSIEAWRAARVARLTAPDGWLSLIGRHLLPAGISSVGTAEDNSIRLAAGPPYLCMLVVTPDRRVTLHPAPAARLEIDGVSVGAPAALVWDSDQPTKVTFGTASFYVMRRGDDLYLRVRDSAAATRTQFAGLTYFPIDPVWRIEADWLPFDPPRQLPITNMIGVTEPQPVPGKAVFTHDGRTVELLPVDEGGDNLFFILTDLTAGQETYEASRFLYVPKPKPGDTKLILDFNRLQNPPCAFTPFATCPLPPKENRLPFRVTAGEKNYPGPH
jgi:uncharacterized protein (DUF1684 family)